MSTRTSRAWWAPSLGAALVTMGILVPAHLKAPVPVLLLERFVPGAGWVEIVLLALYAAGVCRALLDPVARTRWRPWLWRVFSVVFFGQLALGLAGVDQCLMTGDLHLPIPALIVAGPLYRGGGLFMPILFTVTVLLVGPAWCSYLCYIGSWDDAAARGRRRSKPLPRWRNAVRMGIALAVVLVAGAMGLLGVPPLVAAGIALAFGLGGVALMLVWSRRSGAMTHCTLWCPMGLLANVMGKITPFRIRLTDACTDCGACTTACRYDALGPEDIRRRAPGLTCTLCGDCEPRCPHDAISFAVYGRPSTRARTAFVLLVSALHAVFMGVARL